jgi:peptidoglycan/LPS O-acetylase OafA/YrhL
MLTFTLTVQNIQGTPPTRQALFGELLFLQNYLGGIWPHTWSLAVEEHFYLGIAALFSIVLAVRRHKDFDWIPFAFFVVAISCLTLRVLNLSFYPQYSHRAYLAGTHIRIDSLFFGVLISYLFHFRELEKKTSSIPTWLLIAVGICLLAPPFIFAVETNKWLSVVGLIPLYLGSGAMLLAALRLPTSDNFTLKVLAGLGAASYSVYLWHLPVGEWGFTFLSRVDSLNNFNFYFLNYLVGSFAVGWLFSHAIEYPTLQLRNFLFPSRTLAVDQTGMQASKSKFAVPVPASNTASAQI